MWDNCMGWMDYVYFFGLIVCNGVIWNMSGEVYVFYYVWFGGYKMVVEEFVDGCCYV